MKIEGAVFVVTGGASGIGEACVRMAVAAGAKAAIWDMNEKRGADLVEELGADKAVFCKVNVMDAADVDKAVDAVVLKFGRVDCCVNSAGTGLAVPTVSKKNEAHPIDKFTRIIQLNLIGTFLCGSRCAAQMAKQAPNAEGERGLVVNISSIAAFDGQNGQAAYSASKAGVVGMTLPMARDMGKLGIRVNTICPGIVDTPLTGNKKPVDERDPENMPKVMKGLLTSQVFPDRRFARPTEMASLVKFMAETAFMNGETVRLDAGNRMPKL
jgi:NAD(P)-dependent dehydrogenase (short-subunit alcohol dehydrogenase family)